VQGTTRRKEADDDSRAFLGGVKQDSMKRDIQRLYGSEDAPWTM